MAVRIRIVDVLVLVAITTFLIFLVLALPPMGRTSCCSNELSCRSNLRQLGIGFELYRQGPGRNRNLPHANGSAFVLSLWTSGMVEEPNVFLCPTTDDVNGDTEAGEFYGPRGGDPREIDPAHISYAGARNADPRSPLRPLHRPGAVPLDPLVLAADKPVADQPGADGRTPHYDGTVNVLHTDLHVDTLDLGDHRHFLEPRHAPSPLDQLQVDARE